VRYQHAHHVGLEVLERLNALAPRLGHIPLVFLTALTDGDSELRARRLETDDYVAKPIDFEILPTIINARIAGIARHEVWLTHIDLNDREIEMLLGWRAVRRRRKSRTCSAWPNGRSIFTSTTPVPNSVHAPLTCQRRTLALPVAARPVLETNVRSGICVTEDTMRRFRKFTITRIVLLAIGFSLPASDGLAQGSKELVGAWTLVSITVNQGGQKKNEPFGPAPKGSLIFERNGQFSITVTRSDLPKFGSSSRVAGTPEENAAIVQGSIAYFGTYSVGVEDHLVTVHVEGSTFPNWVGTDQKRLFTIIGDELRYTNFNRSSGEGTALVVWKRAK